ncbi:MAG: hypothetical protein IPJ68_05825 [Candidatus Moraniibacteriota bacterium]|nr:MAG: hypothetical protein IPJ68_05825 [Candidatus Moranbacteria bacterium]
MNGPVYASYLDSSGRIMFKVQPSNTPDGIKDSVRKSELLPGASDAHIITGFLHDHLTRYYEQPALTHLFERDEALHTEIGRALVEALLTLGAAIGCDMKK